jgi:hypothetical protein
MERFIRRENIKRYRKLLREVEDESERERILKLLADEERKEQKAEPIAPGPKPKEAKPNTGVTHPVREKTSSGGDK